MATPFSSVKQKLRSSRRSVRPPGARLVVVGNGMVSAKFCQGLVERKLQKHFQVTVIGGEKSPAYDRIRLSSYIEHRQRKRLELLPASWYKDAGIDLFLGTPAASIDRQSKIVRLENDRGIPYDLLVLATGSRPSIPPIEGVDLPNVLVYRTCDDLDAIIQASAEKKAAAVIGGGLLGLEAAQAIQKLGLKATVVERANFLMPQQLNEAASKLLEKSVVSQEIDLVLGASSTTIKSSKGRIELEFKKEHRKQVDLVVISAGIVPNSELADDCDLPTDLRGGVVVNKHLETADPDIFAIGECASLQGRIYGLAAPGYAMAKHLADRLQGLKVMPFGEPDVSTRLKMLGADVITIGTPLQEGRKLEFQSDTHYRMILIGVGGELRGGLGIGPWPEAGKLQTIYARGGRIRLREQSYFEQEGILSLQGETQTPIGAWPEDRIVCNCMAISKGTLAGCLDSCHRDPDLLAFETHASTVCGSCRPLLEELCGTPVTSEQPSSSKRLLFVSCIAAGLVMFAIFAPRFAMAESVDSWRYQIDIIWRDRLIKQISGFGLVGVFLVGLLISARKRFSWITFGHFTKWRFFHALFGLVALCGLFAHTGFRFGHNLNFWLMFTFVGLNLLGAFAGIVTAIEANGTSPIALRARQVRPLLTYAHLVLFWPLPVLLIFHILSVYLY